jgi:RNA polymerase sigma-70 factor (ECF subfamily)
MRSGTDRDFAQLYARHARAVRRYVQRRGAGDATDDIVAETFERAYRHRELLAARGGSPLPWLYVVAGNLVLNHHRTEARRRRAVARLGVRESETVVESEAVELRVASAQLSPLVEEAVARLDEEDRVVWLMRAWSGRSRARLAAALGVPEDVIHTRLRRASRQIRAELSAASW